MPLAIDTLLYNRYRIEKVIAKGGMGSIYRAHDESLGVHVAVKENLFTTEDSTRQFRREATILAGLRHPNLPRVTDHFVLPDQGQYLVMDFIEGEDLKERIQRSGTLPEEEIVLIGSVICGALEYLHTRTPPIVHRDIKPGNIKIAPDGGIFLVDFGIAKISKPGVETTVGAQSLTPGFAPPEQYGKGTDPRSDIYSLGATLYMALTGIVPKNGLARMMKEEQLIPIRDLNPNISTALANCIEKSLEVEREQRYQSAENFKQELLSASTGARRKHEVQGGTVRVEPAPTPKTDMPSTVSTMPVRTHEEMPVSVPDANAKKKHFPVLPLAVGLVVLIAIAVIATLAFSNGFFSRLGIAQNSTNTPAATPITTTNTAVPNTPINTVTATTEPTSTEVVILSTEIPTETPSPTDTPTPQATPLGSGSGQLAFVSERSGMPQIYLMNLDGSDQHAITNEISGACQPDWSPDGEKLVYVSPCTINESSNPITEVHSGASMFIVQADGTNRRPLTTIPGGDFDPAWSPDGEWIAFTSYRDHLSPTDLNLYVYNLSDNSVTQLTADLNIDRRPAWSPDGTQIAFQRQSTLGSTQINIINIASSSITIFSNRQVTDAFMPAWSSQNFIGFVQGNPTSVPMLQQIEPGNVPAVHLSDQPAWDVDFSSDGVWIVFESMQTADDASRNYDIYLMLIEDGSVTRLTQDASRDYQPAWRPALFSEK
jgi:Tol biopolymer transport system component